LVGFWSDFALPPDFQEMRKPRVPDGRDLAGPKDRNPSHFLVRFHMLADRFFVTADALILPLNIILFNRFFAVSYRRKGRRRGMHSAKLLRPVD
jgi:hypothetical protein